MITEIISNIDFEKPVLTSELREIRATVQPPKAHFKLVFEPEGSKTTIYEAVLYAYNGEISIASVGSLIESCFRENKCFYAQVAVILDDLEVRFDAIYCEAIMPHDFDIFSCFLSSTSVASVHSSSTICLAHMPSGSHYYTFDLVGTDCEGSPARITTEVERISVDGAVYFSVKEIVDWALGRGDSEPGADIAKVAYFKISHRNASKIFYLVNDAFFIPFKFKNIFNVPEIIDIQGVITQKTSVSSSTAVCGGRISQYDRNVERKYEFVTGPLTDHEARAVEALVLSSDIAIASSNNLIPVIITDHKLERDNDDSGLTSFSFTFQFANQGLIMSHHDIMALCPDDTHLFSDEFSQEFA